MQVQVEDFGLVDNNILLELQGQGFGFCWRLVGEEGNWSRGTYEFSDYPDVSEYKCADGVCEEALRKALNLAAKPKEYTFEEIVKAYVSNKLWWRFPGSATAYAAEWSPAQDDIELQDLIGMLMNPSDKETPEWFIGDAEPITVLQTKQEAIDELRSAWFFLNAGDEDKAKKSLDKVHEFLNNLGTD